MAEKIAGFVAAVKPRDGKGRRGYWHSWSLKIETADGNEDSRWFSTGFMDGTVEPPGQEPFKQGDYIEFETEQNDQGYWDIVKGSSKRRKNPPARAGAKPVERRNSAPAQQRSGAEASTATAAAAEQNAAADRQTQIVLQHSQEIAVRTVGLLLAHDALPMSGAKTKAGEAKRFAEITAMIDKFTVKAFNDVATGRILTTVADFGAVNVGADGPLPDPSGSAAAKPAAEGADEITPADDEGNDDDSPF